MGRCLCITLQIMSTGTERGGAVEIWACRRLHSGDGMQERPEIAKAVAKVADISFGTRPLILPKIDPRSSTVLPTESVSNCYGP
jgi:hypothetical protein